MGEWTTSDGRVDVAAVMNGIREKIRGRRDLGLEAGPCGRRGRLQILVEQGEVANFDDRTVEPIASDAAHRLRDLAIDAVLAKRADDDGDLVLVHAR